MKLLFNENLHTILQEIYRLVNYAHFSNEYIESLPPLERNLYWAYWLEDQKEQKKQDGQFTAMDENIPRGNNMIGLT